MINFLVVVFSPTIVLQKSFQELSAEDVLSEDIYLKVHLVLSHGHAWHLLVESHFLAVNYTNPYYY